MRIFYLVFIASLIAVACKPTYYTGSYGNVNQTEVVLTQANFKVLGSFVGVATKRKNVASIKHREGLIADAKKDLLEDAKENGVELSGSRTMINVTVDFIENHKRATCTITADIIEFK